MRRAGAALLAAVWIAGVAGAEERAPEAVDLSGADVVLLGELHDNPAHHANQALWVAQMRPAALVFEMLTPDLALVAQGAADRPPAQLGALLEWEARGWPDFAMYAPIFTAVPGVAIFGGGVPQEDARRAVREGAAAVMGDSAPLFGLDEDLPEEEADTRIAGQAAAHCDALPDDLLPGMVEAQRLRDAALARAVIAAMAETGGPVAVITGNGHARRDWGIPAKLARAASDLTVLSVGQFEAPPEEGAPFDVWTLSPAPPRGDPCDVFR
ncbi:hypothetical protein DXV76_03165 [Rhodobacteraceae bacterium CCMM004]|nr:hypothetical protein DXV76_03165 [Rhodobacteraceae bacterium CCMM004]